MTPSRPRSKQAEIEAGRDRRRRAMDSELCRLALFLDPRYKAAAATKDNLKGIMEALSGA